MNALLAAACVSTAALSSPGSRPAPTTNVMVIVLDDVGAGFVGAYDQYWQSIGRPSAVPAHTPALDELIARQGLMFTNAWACPVCTPTRSNMLTGRWGHHTGMGTPILSRELIANPGLEPNVHLLPQYLHAADVPYTCAAVGKWHLADRYQILATPAHPLGSPSGTWFDRYAGVFFNLDRFPDVGPTETGYWEWEKQYSTYIQLGVNPCDVGEPPCSVDRNANVSHDQYATVDTIDDAMTLVQELPQPWFMYVAPNAIHAPLSDPPNDLQTTTCDTYGPPAVPYDYPGLTMPPTRSREMLEALDGQLGRLLCMLDPQTTTIIVIGDNGPAKRVVLPPYDWTRSKNTVYQNGLEVPLMVRSPFLDPSLVGQHCDALVGAIDIFATVLELAGIEPQSIPNTDSVSFLPCMTTPGVESPRQYIYAETFTPNFIPDAQTDGPPSSYYTKRHDQAIRDSRFKLIRKWRRDHQTGVPYYVEELYDLVAGGPPESAGGPPTPDWLELNNLLDSPDPLPLEAQLSYDTLRTELDVNHPTVLF